jgi:hypothetical protein
LQLNWFSAKTDCAQMGKELVSVETKEENDAIVAVISKNIFLNVD